MPAKIATYATPRRLYRFRPLQKGTESLVAREMKAIQQGFVFCPTFSQMNDPMEGTHTESALLRGAPNHETTIAKVTAAKEALGIAAFSEALKHEPMWAHYAGNFSGICIEYSFNKLLAGLADDAEMVRIAYSESPPILLKNRKGATEMAKLTLSSKAVRWASEREWRLMQPKQGEASYGATSCVTAVYLGSRVSTPDAEAVRKAVRGLKIPVLQMEFDKYSIEFPKRQAGLKRKLLAKPTITSAGQKAIAGKKR